MKLKPPEYNIEEIKKPFSFATFFSYAPFKEEEKIKRKRKHIEMLEKYLRNLIKHSQTEKCRVIENQFKKEEVNQPDFFFVKEQISWGCANRMNTEIQAITNHINFLENE